MLVKLDCGIELDVNKESFNDMRVLDCLAELEENPLAISKLCKLLLTKEQKDLIYKQCDDDGRVDVTKFSQIFGELMTKLGSQDNEIKN